MTLAERLADSLDARDRRASMDSATGYRAAVAQRRFSSVVWDEVRRIERLTGSTSPT